MATIAELERKRCNRCPAWIVWVRTTNGKAMPLDPAPVADGNVVPTALVEDGLPVVRVLTKVEASERVPGGRYKSHHATCGL